jgi:hypothetical protein
MRTHRRSPFFECAGDVRQPDVEHHCIDPGPGLGDLERVPAGGGQLDEVAVLAE